MSQEQDKSIESRTRAEAELQRKFHPTTDTTVDGIDKIVHELQTHQIELEMQNEELRRTQVELLESRNAYSDLYDFAPVGYLTLSEKGQILRANLTLVDLLGLERSLLVKRRLSSFIVNDDQGTYSKFQRTLLEQEQRQTCELRMHQNGAEPLWVRLDGAVDGTTHGEGVQIRIAITDISKHKQAEEALKKSEARNHKLLEGSLVCNKIIDLDSRLVYMSTAGVKDLKIPDIKPFYGCTYPPEFFPESMRIPLIEHLQRAKAGETCSVECLVLDMEGGEVWFHTTFSPVRDDEHRVEFVVATSVNITDRKRAEEALRESEETNCLLVEHAPHCIHQIDMQGRFVSMNPAGLAMMDVIDEQEIIGVSYLDVVAESDQDRIEQLLQAALNGKESEFEFTAKNDRDFASSFIPIVDEDGKVVRLMGLTQDITERKRAENALLESQALYESLVAHIPQSIFRKDLNGCITYACPNLCKLLQRSAKEIVGLTDYDLYPRTLAEKYQRDDFQVASTGETLELSEEHETPDGTIQYMQVLKTPIYDHHQQIVGVQGIFWDITDQRKIEETIHQRENELAHAGRLSLMGEMVAGLAHEINQPLYSIGNFSKACENHIEQNETLEKEKLSQWLGEISVCARNSKEILARLKGFARQSVSQRKSLSIDRAIDESIKMLEFELHSSSVAIKYDLEEGILVYADDVQVQQVLANLIHNACEAFYESGIEDARLKFRTNSCGEFCEVSVEDNGPGMNEEQMKRAFQSFSTTKSSGLGLGLAISKTIIEGHNGKMTIVPNRDRGITCHFTLPLVIRGDK